MASLITEKRDAFGRWALVRGVDEAHGELTRAAALHPQAADTLNGLAQKVAGLKERLDRAEVNITVVGAVKSGKSTLVNAMLGEDILPRGSGIVTAKVARIKAGDVSSARIVWKSEEEVQRDFENHLEGMGIGKQLSIHDGEARGRALEAARSGGPHSEPLRALVEGYDSVDWRGGEGTGEEDVFEAARYAGREEVAAYLKELDLTVATHDAPRGLVFTDCQGADAWNAAHHAGVEESLVSADAVIYVFSSRIGLREADFKLISALRDYGVLEITHFVMNVDLGEVRAPGEVERLVKNARDGLEREGISGRLWCFSALNSLLERRMLIDPQSVWEGEQRLMEVWKGHFSDFLVNSTSEFTRFRQWLEELSETGREGALIASARTELRKILVDASRYLVGSAGVAASQGDASGALLEWAQRELDKTVEYEAAKIRNGVHGTFTAKSSPQRKIAMRAAQIIGPEPSEVIAQAGGDGLSACALYRSQLREEVVEELRQSEPLRVNGVRNFALETRGNLAKKGEELAVEMAGKLTEAGYVVGSIPVASEIVREITVTRKIPLFSTLFAREYANTGGAGTGEAGEGAGSTLASFVRKLIRPGTGSARAVVSAEAAARKASLKLVTSRLWRRYGDTVVEECLVPHVEEAAAQVYARIASWLVVTVTGGGEGALAALAKLDKD